jgi:hypothetical protein
MILSFFRSFVVFASSSSEHSDVRKQNGFVRARPSLDTLALAVAV